MSCASVASTSTERGLPVTSRPAEALLWPAWYSSCPTVPTQHQGWPSGKAHAHARPPCPPTDEVQPWVWLVDGADGGEVGVNQLAHQRACMK